MKPNKMALTGALLLALSACPTAQAYDFKAGSVFYNYTSPQKKGTVVTYFDLQNNLEAYTDNVVIPGKVSYNGSEIPVRGIGDHALFNCQFVTSVVIKDGPSYIMDQAFSHCYGMKTLTLPSTLTFIGDYAFEYCEDLTTVTIPAAVEEFGSNVFTNCNGLTEIKVEEGNPILEDIDGVLYLKSPKMLVQYPSGKGADEYTIPAGVTVVAPYAFSPAYNLHTITIGPDVERIRPLTFTDCPLLTDIVVDEQNPNNCTIDGALYDKAVETLIQYPRSRVCEELSLPEGVVSADAFALNGCTDIRNLVLPESFRSIDDFCLFNSRFNSITCKSHRPPVVGSYAIDENTYNNTILYVNAADVDTYRKAAGWSSFKQILPIGSSAVSDIDIDRRAVSTEWFDMQGLRIEKPASGMAISVTTYSDGTISRTKEVL